MEDWETLAKKPMRDGYGEMLAEIGKKDGRVVALIADLLDSLRLDLFKKDFPDRVIELGIAEQNMMGVGAGLAMGGKVPFVNSIACFNPGYNWNQLRVSVCLGRENVKIVGGHAGFGNGVDGANQQAFEDMALTRVLPNLVVLAPADYEQVKKAVMAMVEYNGPVYMRITKLSREIITTNITPFELGKAQVFCGGRDVSIFACGAGVAEAMRAAKQLEGEVEVEVINVHTIKPIDKETLVRSAKKTKKVITVEEHSVIGGLGSAVAEVLAEEFPTRMRRIGMPDCFGESGEPEELMKKYGITADNIVLEIRKIMKEND
ncbi:hypothetical protein A2572_03045 [Candidatus Collierbacteria bacterium RIFOXYD1_FULL_40_9]|uniref:Transketolase-like pyrimidine-binding domain-containing protein n=1 Tax=Candidatus Collierbacteria bacterium RIFOXYD1_FULL_40_9 TaxID=1817731 RepID=A0A1F5FX07_9BACT|nr:MAG: hypothetical protein A2572_03045 [Candidatus Collierbacteria bacterium RIFOXYD1_FULL_40_9]